MIDKTNPPSHLKQMDTGRIYVYTPLLAQRADMEPCDPPKRVEKVERKPEPVKEQTPVVEDPPEVEEVPEQPESEVDAGQAEEVAETDSSPEVEMTPEQRKALIKGAASMVDKEHWVKGTTAWPTSPSTTDIEAIVGFKVSRREIIDAIKE